MTVDRLSCCVPFCRHTRGLRKGETELPGEWICSKHWRAVSPAKKARKRQVERRYKKLINGQSEAHRAAFRQCCEAWAECKAEVIEATMGIR